VIAKKEADKLHQTSETPGKGLKCGAGEGWRRSVGPTI
jgi:hypothetical protein